jgi:hypothetical protein
MLVHRSPSRNEDVAPGINRRHVVRGELVGWSRGRRQPIYERLRGNIEVARFLSESLNRVDIESARCRMATLHVLPARRHECRLILHVGELGPTLVSSHQHYDAEAFPACRDAASDRHKGRVCFALLCHSRSPSAARRCGSRARSAAADAAYRDNIARERHPVSAIKSVSPFPSASHRCAKT